LRDPQEAVADRRVTNGMTIKTIGSPTRRGKEGGVFSAGREENRKNAISRRIAKKM